jgi:DNA-binding response OmpR family regulator
MNSKRILLIDDEEVITFGFAKVLKEPGMEIDCAQSLHEAQKLISTHQYSAAVVDLRLSDSINMEGFECVRLLRANASRCQVIVMTAYGGNGIKAQAQALGVDLFFEKPVEPEIVKDALRGFGVYDSSSSLIPR